MVGLFSPSPVSQPGVQLANFSVADISEPFSWPLCLLLPPTTPLPHTPLSLRISVSRYPLMVGGEAVGLIAAFASSVQVPV